MGDVPLQIITADRDMTTDEARKITDAIRNGIADLELTIVKAYQGRAWLALGYESWDAYVTGEFKRAPLPLPREERQAAVQSLRGWGLSTRAIAPVVGVHHDTVASDLSENPTPVIGLDGKTYKPRRTGSTRHADPAPTMITCPTCGGTGKVTQ